MIQEKKKTYCPSLITDRRVHVPLSRFLLCSTAQAASSAFEQLDEISYPPVYRAGGSAEIFQILLYTLGAGGSML